MTAKINLDEKFGLFSEHWRPKIIAAANGQEVIFGRQCSENRPNFSSRLILAVIGGLSQRPACQSAP